jgi:hypothetical protein
VLVALAVVALTAMEQPTRVVAAVVNTTAKAVVLGVQVLLFFVLSERNQLFLLV